MALLGFAFAALIGIALGLLGAGGSILTVPVFVYLLGFEAKQAIAMSLPVVGTASLVGALRLWRERCIDLRVAFCFGPVAMLGAYVGARLAALLSGVTQLTILGVAVLAAALAMLRDSPAAPADGRDPSTPARGRLVLVAVVALGVGMLTGLVGIGGGFLIVPALVVLVGVPMRMAVGTSLAIIAMNCVAGSLGYREQVMLPWGFMAVFTSVAVAGIFIGLRLARRVSPRALRRGFALFLLGIGGFMLYGSRNAAESAARGSAVDR